LEFYRIGAALLGYPKHIFTDFDASLVIIADFRNYKAIGGIRNFYILN
jgi:hypothetical protein